MAILKNEFRTNARIPDKASMIRSKTACESKVNKTHFSIKSINA